MNIGVVLATRVFINTAVEFSTQVLMDIGVECITWVERSS